MTQKTCHTRLADLSQADDVALAIELLNMYACEPTGNGGPLPSSVQERLAADLPRLKHLFVVLAEDESHRPVGVAVCFEGYSTFNAAPLVNIHDLAVVPDARGRGVGKSLLAAVEREARRRGCCKITLEVRSDNAAAMHVYRQWGFTGGPPEQAMQFWSYPLEDSANS